MVKYNNGRVMSSVRLGEGNGDKEEGYQIPFWPLLQELNSGLPLNERYDYGPKKKVYSTSKLQGPEEDAGIKSFACQTITNDRGSARRP